MPKTESYNSVICPFCRYEHGDPWEWAMNEEPAHKVCERCDRRFVFWASIDVRHYAREAAEER